MLVLHTISKNHELCGLAVLDWLIIRSRMRADSIEALQRLKRLLESSGEIN
jgi:hypothetical protein